MTDYKDETEYSALFVTEKWLYKADGYGTKIWRDPSQPNILGTLGCENNYLLWKNPQYNSILIEKGLYPHINFQRIGMINYNYAKSHKNEISKWCNNLSKQGLTFYPRTGKITPIKEVQQDDIKIKMLQNKKSFEKGEPIRHVFEGESKRDKIDYLAISMKQLGIKTIKEIEKESKRLADIENKRLVDIENKRLTIIEEKRLLDLSIQSQELESFYDFDKTIKEIEDDIQSIDSNEGVESIESIQSIEGMNGMQNQILLEKITPVMLLLGAGIAVYLFGSGKFDKK